MTNEQTIAVFKNMIRSNNEHGNTLLCIGEVQALDMAIEALSAQRTGEWLRYGEDGNPNEEDTVFWQCDQCLETYTGRTTRIPNYCPNCGADMRGEQE